MIRHIVQCDTCETQADVSVHLISIRQQELPVGWITLTQQGQTDRHFCCSNCIANYVYEKAKGAEK